MKFLSPNYESCFKLLLSLIFGCTALSLCHAAVPERTQLMTVEYHGIRPTDPLGSVGLRNPERGLRIETMIADSAQQTKWWPVTHLKGKVVPKYSETGWILDAQKYEPFGVTLALTYCYLNEYNNCPIPKKKLDLLQKSFDNLRKCGLKAVLRFAYEQDMAKKNGPTVEWMLRHMEQLKPIIRRNTDVIYILQMGIIGAWGEWHSSTHVEPGDYKAQAMVVKKMLELLPNDRMTQVRVPKYKRQALSEEIINAFEDVTAGNAHTMAPAARIGFHNDGFLAAETDGGTWTEPPYFGNPGNPEFDYMTKESAFVPIDGEMFVRDLAWDGKDTAKKGVDGFNAALRMRLHHYGSFSLRHSYSEQDGDENYSIDRWMIRPVKKQQLQEAKMPISDGYFEDSFGNEVSRSQFEYIRDHLGYRIELQKAKFPAKITQGKNLRVQLEFINRGFSVMHNRRPVYIVLIAEDGGVTKFEVKTDVRKWQPFRPGDAEYRPIRHKIGINAPLPNDIGEGWYQIGLWMPDAYQSLRNDCRYAVRVANRDVVWWKNEYDRYGVNIFGVVRIENN